MNYLDCQRCKRCGKLMRQTIGNTTMWIHIDRTMLCLMDEKYGAGKPLDKGVATVIDER